MNYKKQVGVVGGGMIGISLCALLTGNGVQTILYARSRLPEKRAAYRGIFRGLETKGLLRREERIRCESYFRVTDSYRELEHVEIVLESGPEDIEAKREIYGSLYRSCPKLQAVASTTSSIPSLELAQCSRMPDKVLVAHPFYPPHLIPCVEVVPNQGTSQGALQAVVELLEYLKRETAIIRKDAPGFIANRLQYALLREAVHIVEEGIAEPEEVDRVLKYSFIPRYTSIGLFEHFDNCGLDLAGNICDRLYPELSNADSTQDLIRARCTKGEYGVESGRGIYSWDERKTEELRERAEKPYLESFSWRLPKDMCGPGSV